MSPQQSVLAAILLALAPPCFAQSKAAGTPAAFDVAVIRPTTTQDVMGSSHSHIWSAATDGHLKAQNVTPLALIQYAYALPEIRIEGGPDWIRTRKFDLEAKSDPALDDQFGKLPSDEARARKLRMLQALLADRFALKVHEETRTQPIYALLVAKGGPKFGPSQKNGTTASTSSNNGNVTMTVQGTDHTLRVLAEQLSRRLGRIVVDKTGLDGRFDLTLKWVSDDLSAAGPDAPSGPSLFTALQEQLGLKLESEKGPVTILVIDHIEPPSDN
jgi:uncharacterized protein (TIGR03435 family)